MYSVWLEVFFVDVLIPACDKLDQVRIAGAVAEMLRLSGFVFGCEFRNELWYQGVVSQAVDIRDDLHPTALTVGDYFAEQILLEHRRQISDLLLGTLFRRIPADGPLTLDLRMIGYWCHEPLCESAVVLATIPASVQANSQVVHLPSGQEVDQSFPVIELHQIGAPLVFHENTTGFQCGPVQNAGCRNATMSRYCFEHIRQGS